LSSALIQNATQTKPIKLAPAVTRNARCAISSHAKRGAGRFFGSFLAARPRKNPAAGRDRRTCCWFNFELLTNNQSLAGRQPRTLPHLLAPKRWEQKAPHAFAPAAQVPGAEQMNAGRAKLADAQTGCPAVSASIHSSPALSLNGGKSKTIKSLKRAGSAILQNATETYTSNHA